MNAVLAWLLNLEADTLNEPASWRLEFLALPAGGAVAAWMFGLAAAAGVAILCYRWESRELSAASRFGLTSLRLLVLLIAAALLFEPALTRIQRETFPSRLPVLVDASQSMGLADPYSDTATAQATARRFGLTDDEGGDPLKRLRRATRWELTHATLTRLEPELANNRLLTRYRFAEDLAPLPTTAASSPASAPRWGEPTGSATALGDALAKAQALHRGQPLAGMLVVSDGRWNSGRDPLAAVESAIVDGVPLFILGAGTVEPPRNLRLAELAASPVVFVKDPIEATALVESQGLEGKTAEVTLELRRDGGAWEEVGREAVIAGEDGRTQRVAFRLNPDAPGLWELRARVGGAEAEWTEDDNQAVATTRVVRRKIRVLLLAGAPSPEMQFLRNTLLRDASLEFSSWLQSADAGFEQAGDRPLRRLPDTQEELDHFDVLLLLDPDTRALGPQWSERLTRFVGQAGGGVIFVAGELYTAQLFQQASEGNPLAEWVKTLPVARDAGLYASAARATLSSLDTWTMELSEAGLDDPIFAFTTDPARRRNVLASLPGMFWHFEVTRARPGAVVLARHGDPRMQNQFGRHVLLAMQWYGPGRSAFVGFDSTHRWRYLDEQHFDGFWARLIDRVGRNKVLGGRHPFTLATDKNSYRAGEQATLAIRYQHANDADSGPSLSAELDDPTGQTQPVTLEPSVDSPGSLEATLPLPRPGDYTVRVLSAAGEGETAPRPAVLTIKARAPQRELEQPTLQRTLLQDLANRTGGAYFDLADADRLPAAIRLGAVERTREFRHSLWDTPLLTGLLVTLLSLEWLGRKLRRLA